MRYKGVSNASYLERQLDNIIVGGLKLHVNIPKYGRGKEKPDQNIAMHGWRKEGGNQRGRMEAGPNMRRSYAEVVISNTVNLGRLRSTPSFSGEHGGSHSTVTIEISEESRRKYTDTWVGRLKRQQVFERVEDELSWILGTEVSPKYLGDDMVLLIGLSDTKAQEMMREEANHGTSTFYAMEKRNSNIKPGNRLIWVQCWGVPLVAWNIDNLRKIVAAVGDLVEVDDNFEDMQRLDRARALIRTPRRLILEHTVTAHIDGDIHKIFIAEESGGAAMTGMQHRRDAWGSSEEIFSEGDSGTSQSRLSDIPSHSLAAELHDDPVCRQERAITAGQKETVDSMGNIQSSSACRPNVVLHHLRAENGMKTHLEDSHLTQAGAGYDEGGSQHARAADTITLKGKAISGTLLASTDESQEWGADVVHERKEGESTNNPNNGPLQDILNKSRDVNVTLFGPNSNLGPHRPSTPENQLEDQQNQPESVIQVYSRKKGGTKRWAQGRCRDPCHEECKDGDGQSQTALGKEGKNTSVNNLSGGNSMMDPNVFETQPQDGGALQIGDEDIASLHAEAKAQWDMANQLGMSCGTDPTKIIDKIAEMEVRDRKEAETLGKRNNSS